MHFLILIILAACLLQFVDDVLWQGNNVDVVHRLRVQ